MPITRRIVALAALVLARVVHGDEIDVRGSWQATLVCGSFGDAAVGFQLDEALDTGAVAATAGAPCGTVAFFPTVPLLGCATTPAIVGGQVTGTAFSLPDAGTFETESFVAPFGSCPVERITTQQALAGTITDDGAGRATAIDGTLVTAGVALRRANGVVCSSYGPEIPDCTLAMRRNDLPAGTAVPVEPLAGFSFVVGSVTSPGALIVGPTPSQRATLPPALTPLQIGDDLRFWDLVTNATVSGPVDVCISYPDADGNGFYDGAVLPLSESRLSLMQAEAGLFVDRTTSRDPIANRICGTLPSLEQITLANPYAVGPFVDRPIAASKLKLENRQAGLSRLIFATKDPALLAPVPGSADDPAVGDPGGMLLEMFASPIGSDPVRRGIALLDAAWTAPRAGRWQYRHDWSYGRDKATFTAGRALSMTLWDALVRPDLPIGRVALRIQLGRLRSCALFTEASVKRDDPGRFVAARAPAPALPDCSDATLSAAVTP